MPHPIRGLLVTLLLLPAFVSFAQAPTTPITSATIVAPSGKLTFLKLDSLNGYKPAVIQRTPELLTADNKAKVDVRNVIQDKVRTAQNALEDGNELAKYIALMYDQSTLVQLRKDLDTLQKFLNIDDNAFNLDSTTYFTHITRPAKKYLFTKSDTIFTAGPRDSVNNMYTVELSKKSPYNQFVIAYYNATIGPSKATDLDYSRLLSYIDEISELSREADSLKVVFKQREKKGAYSLDFVDYIRELNGKILSSEAYHYLKQENKKTWFANWLWFRGGDIRLNPMDFTTEAFIKQQFDANRNVFTNADTLKKMIAENQARTASFTLTEELISRVQVPVKGPIYSMSVEKDFSAPQNSEAYLEKTLSEKETKTVIIHNIPRGYTAALIEKRKENKDATTFERATDSLNSLLTLVAGYVVQFNSYGNLLGNITGQNRIAPDIITKNANHSEEKALGFQGEDEEDETSVKIYIKKQLGDSLYRKALVDSLAGRVPALRLLAAYSPENRAQVRAIKEFFKKYSEVVKERTLAAKQLLSEDLLLTRFWQNILQQSSIPLRKLEGHKDDNPLYFSAMLTTTPNKGSTLDTITPYVYIKDKDTVWLKTFAYERGNHYRFQISAGVAYTASAFVQTTVTNTNGKISVTNSSQLYQLSIGMHVYLGKGLMPKDDRCPGPFLDRSSIYVGIGIPEPLENFYLGYSYDLIPGLKTITGMRFYRHNQYEIQNDVIVSERLKYKVALPFFAIQIDPGGFLKALNIFKKN